MPKPRTTRVVSTTKVEAGRKSAAGRPRDERGRLLPRDGSPAPAPEPSPAPPSPAPEPTPDPAPPFRELRRRWNPVYGRRSSRSQDQ